MLGRLFRSELQVRYDAIRPTGKEWQTGWSYRHAPVSEKKISRVQVTLSDPSGLKDGVVDAAIPPALLIGMMGPFTSIRIKGGKVCPVLAKGSEVARKLMLERFGDAHSVQVRASLRKKTVASKENTYPGVCFTGGVDSCFSAYRLRHELSGLLFVNGFDVPLKNTALFQQVKRHLDLLASDLELPLFIMSTNLREVTDAHGLLWGKRAFGVALASMAHLMPDPYSGLAIPASFDLSNQVVAGSMPDLDPLWSSARRTVTHHGNEFSRYDKIKALRDWPLALRNLRVCWRNPGNAYNCGQCEKCVRTLVLIELAGLSHYLKSFETKLDIRSLQDLDMGSNVVFSHWEQIYSYVRENSKYDSLRQGIEIMLKRNRTRLGLYQGAIESAS